MVSFAPLIRGEATIEWRSQDTSPWLDAEYQAHLSIVRKVARGPIRTKPAAARWATGSRRARRNGDAPALIAPDGYAQSFRQTSDRVHRLAADLVANGSDPAIAWPCWPSTHWRTWSSCSRAWCPGRRSATSTTGSAHEIAKILSTAGPNAIFVDERYRSIVEEIGFSDRLAVWSVDGDGPQSVEAAISRSPQGTDLTAASLGEDIVSIAFTSGTTGVPKGVLQSERMLRNIIVLGHP